MPAVFDDRRLHGVPHDHGDRVIVRCFSAMAVFGAAVLSAGLLYAPEVSDAGMPEAASVAGRELPLNGMGMRKEAVFFKAYLVGLYLEKPTTDAHAAITTDEAKRIVIDMLRDVSREMFVEAVERGMMRNSGSAMPSLRVRLDVLEHALPALKKGNAIDITYLPGVGTMVRGQGQKMTIPGKDFSDALFSVWLGSKPIDDDLKRELLGGYSHKAGNRESSILSGNSFEREGERRR